MKTLKILNIVFLLAIFLSGCLAPTLPQVENNAIVEFDPSKVKSSDFAREIGALVVISEDTKSSNLEKAEAHRRLAILYLSPGNPNRDFSRAVVELGKFLEVAPGQLDNGVAANWLTALQAGQEYQAMKDQYQKLKKQVVKLEAKNQQLFKEKNGLTVVNAELTKTIDKLKKLDLALEKKRRDIR